MKYATWMAVFVISTATEGWTPSSKICNRSVSRSTSCPRYSCDFQASSDKVTVDDREALMSQINELASAFEQVQDTIQANAKLYEQKMDDYEEDIDNLKMEIDKQIIGIMTRDNDIKELKARLADAESARQNGETQILREEINKLVLECEEVKKEMKLKDEKIGELSANLNGKENDIRTKAKDIAKLEELLEKANDEKNRLQTIIDENQQRLNVLENQEKLLKDKLEASMSKIRASDDEIETLKGTLSKVRADLDALTTERDATRIDLGTAEKRMKEKELAWEEEKREFLIDKKISLEELQDSSRREKELLLEENSTLLAKINQTQLQVQEMDERIKRMVKDTEDRVYLADQGDVKLRKEIIDIRAKSYQRLMDMQVKSEIQEKQLGDEIKELTQRLEQYEVDRRSLRKLSAWAICRLGSVFSFGRKKGVE
jgi:hypothetical protein